MTQILTIENGMIEEYKTSDYSKSIQISKNRKGYACDGWTVAITNETAGRFLRVYHPRINDHSQVCAKHFKLRDGVLKLICENDILEASFSEKTSTETMPTPTPEKVIIRDWELDRLFAL